MIQYAKISKRKVSKDSAAPFIHDDFLIFTLIIGILKYENDSDWLLKVIRSRAKNATTTTFENLLTGNFRSKANIQSLTLVLLYMLNESKITNELLDEAYEAINIQNAYNNDFTRIIQHSAFDIIIMFKLPRDSDEVSRLLEFENKFKKRINLFSYIAYNGLLLLILLGAYKLLHSFPEEWKLKINEVGIIIGIGGFGLIGNVIPKLKTKFQQLVMKAFGYRIRKEVH